MEGNNTEHAFSINEWLFMDFCISETPITEEECIVLIRPKLVMVTQFDGV